MDKASAATADSKQLPTELLLLVLGRLPPGELALAGRLMCKDAAKHFSKPEHKTAPGSALDARLLTFDDKLRLLSSVAASGRESNVLAAWGLLSRSFVRGLLSGRSFNRYTYIRRRWWDDMGSAAVKAGHPGLLSCLTDNQLLVHPTRTLIEAAKHGDLASFQSAWRLLTRGWSGHGYEGGVKVWALRNAARPQSPDSQGKIAWLLDEASGAGPVPARGAERIRLLVGAAAGAAETGNLPVLRWLREVQGLGTNAEQQQSVPGSRCSDVGRGSGCCTVGGGRGGLRPARAGGPGRAGRGLAVGGGTRYRGQHPLAAGSRRPCSNAEGSPGRGVLPARPVRRGAELGAVCCCGGLWQRTAGVLAAGQGMSHQPGGLQRSSGRRQAWDGGVAGGAARQPEVPLAWLEAAPAGPHPGRGEGVKPEDVAVFHKSLKARGREWRRVLDGRHALAWAATMGYLCLIRFFMQEWAVAPGPDTLAATARGGCEVALDLVLECGGNRA